MVFYGVKKGRVPGVYSSWTECKMQIHKFKGAEYKKFATFEKAFLFTKSLDKDVSMHTDCIPESETITTGPEKIVHIYTDGSCIRNGTPLAQAAIGVYFGPNDSRNIGECIMGKQTNNVAEITAILRAISILKRELNDASITTIFHIHTDSKYVMTCASSYGQKQEKLQWKKKIPNYELVKMLYTQIQQYKHKIQLVHVRAHTGGSDVHSLGNSAADVLANTAAQKGTPTV